MILRIIRLITFLALMAGITVGLVRPLTAVAAPDQHQQLTQQLDKLTDVQRESIQSQAMAVADDEKWCPQETGVCVQGDFLFRWKATSRAMFLIGLPVSEPTFETLEDGNKYWVQYFERQRMELHPEAPPAYRVQFGLLGNTVLSARPAAADIMKVGDPTPCEYRFAQTQKCVSGDFKRFFEQNGGIDAFGFAISNPTNEKLEDGQVYWVQYFQRVRLELHPESPDGYKVSLGQFGRYYVESRDGGYGKANNFARCLATEMKVTDPNAWWPKPELRFVIGTAWNPAVKNGDKPLDFGVQLPATEKIDLRIGGMFWTYPWSCGPQVRVDFEQIKAKMPEKGLQELLDLNLARRR